MKKQKIIIPLDETSFSRQVIPAVCNLYEPEAVSLVLLHVASEQEGLLSAPPRAITDTWLKPLYNSPKDAELSHHPIYPLQAESSERARIMESLLPVTRLLHLEGYSATAKIEFGDPVTTIIEVALAEQADLVAMATHGRSGLTHFIQGSIAEQVLRRLTIPLLLVRPSDDIQPADKN